MPAVLIYIEIIVLAVYVPLICGTFVQITIITALKRALKQLDSAQDNLMTTDLLISPPAPPTQ
jgi:hypothetical protein